MSNKASTPPSAGRGRGRGYGIDHSPLRKPTGDSRNSSRPGSATQSPRHSQLSTPNRPAPLPKTTVSDSSVAASMRMPLDATAAAFVPKTVRSLPALSVSATEFIPEETMQIQYKRLITNLELMLQELLDFPSRYDQSVPNIANYLRSTFTGEQFIDIACDVIFEWALSYKHFSYTCARICQHVSEHVHNDHNGRFHQHFLKRCHKEYLEIEHLISNDQNRLCSFAIFLAELYTKQLGRVKPVRKALMDVVQRLINALNDGVSVCVVQVLKLSGACLEDDLAAAEGVSQMDEMLHNIVERVNNGAVSERNGRMLSSIPTLRSTNWGRGTSPSITPVATPTPGQEFSQEPVFFSHNGQRITREEAGYGEEEFAPNLNNGMNPLATNRAQWSTNDGQYVDSGTTGGAAGDFSEMEEMINTNAGIDDSQDIFVIDDEDEQMTEEMWQEYEKFESERDVDLQRYHEDHEQG